MPDVDCAELADDIQQAEVEAADFYAGNPSLEDYNAREDKLFDSESALATAEETARAYEAWDALQKAEEEFERLDRIAAREIEELRVIGNALSEAGRLADQIEDDLASIEEGDGTDPDLISQSLDQLDEARGLVSALQGDWDAQASVAEEADNEATEAFERLQDAQEEWERYSDAHSDGEMTSFSRSQSATAISDFTKEIASLREQLGQDTEGKAAAEAYKQLARHVNELKELENSHCAASGEDGPIP